MSAAVVVAEYQGIAISFTEDGWINATRSMKLQSKSANVVELAA